jgi:hypothetical protein
MGEHIDIIFIQGFTTLTSNMFAPLSHIGWIRFLLSEAPIPKYSCIRAQCN